LTNTSPIIIKLLLYFQLVAIGSAFAHEANFDQPATGSNPSLQLTLWPDAVSNDAGSSPFLDSISVTEKASERPWYDSGYPWKGGPPRDEPDSPGLKRDTFYFLGYQFVIAGALYLMPESVSKWKKGSDRDTPPLEQWWENVTNPVMDQDEAWVNYIAHPYWGATYYIRGRERGLDKGQSFLLSAFLSTLFEYGLEAFAEPVSIQDLIITPVLGSLVGEYLFSPVRESIRAKPGVPTWSDKTILFLTDPLGVVGSWTDQTFGVNVRLSVQPIGQTSTRLGNMDSDTGLPPQTTHATQANRPWGLQLQATW